MNVFWHALCEKGARDYRAVTRRSLPSAFHRNLPEISITNRNCSNMSKNAQAEHKAKARFQALLRRRRVSRRSLKERRFSRLSPKELLSFDIAKVASFLMVRKQKITPVRLSVRAQVICPSERPPAVFFLLKKHLKTELRCFSAVVFRTG